jgi:hypothetical protein
LIVREPCEKARYFWKPNASGELLVKSASFLPVSSTAMLGRFGVHSQLQTQGFTEGADFNASKSLDIALEYSKLSAHFLKSPIFLVLLTSLIHGFWL